MESDKRLKMSVFRL